MFRKVIWATDGSDAGDQLLVQVRALAADGGGEVVVVYCEEFTLPGKGGGSLPIHADEPTVQERIERQVAELSDAGVSARFEMTTSLVGNAAHPIAELAKKEQADVIVVGTRGRTQLAGLLLGSVTHRLLQIAPCPVLAVPTRQGKTG